MPQTRTEQLILPQLLSTARRRSCTPALPAQTEGVSCIAEAQPCCHVHRQTHSTQSQPLQLKVSEQVVLPAEQNWFSSVKQWQKNLMTLVSYQFVFLNVQGKPSSRLKTSSCRQEACVRTSYKQNNSLLAAQHHDS